MIILITKNWPRIGLAMALIVGCAVSPLRSAEPTPVNRPVEFKAPFADLPKADVMPRPRFQSRTAYPKKFQGSGIIGEATVHFVVDAKGMTHQVQVSRATDIAFADAAVEAVKKWVWLPATKDSKPVPVQVVVPVIVKETSR